jgi:hypothetical protein
MGHFASYYKSKLSYVWDADFLAFWERTTGTPDSWMTAYNDLFVNLKNAGIFQKADVFLLLAGHNESDSRLNLIKNAHNATAHNSPTFTQKQGFKGNGINAYLHSHYNPSSEGINYQLNDAGVYVYIYEANTGGNKYQLGAYSTGSNATFIAADASSAEAVNGGFAALGIPYDVVNIRGNSRTVSGSIRSFWNDSFYNLTSSSNIVTPFDIYLLTLNEAGSPGNFYSNAKQSMKYAGGALSDVEVFSLKSIILSWFTAIADL